MRNALAAAVNWSAAASSVADISAFLFLAPVDSMHTLLLPSAKETESAACFS